MMSELEDPILPDEAQATGETFGAAKAPRKSKPSRPVPTTLPQFLKTEDAAIHLGLAARTLEKHRTYGTGPVFRKLGGRVVYAIVDLDIWAEIGTRRSTSDRGTGTVRPAKRQPGYIVRR